MHRLLGCLLLSCAHVERKVTFVDDSQDTSKAWLCVRSLEDKHEILCADLSVAMEAYKQHRASEF